MQTTTLTNDIRLLYVTADSFPEGIEAAHKKLHALLPFDKTRNYFGISRPENNGLIVYRAAAEEMTNGEAEKLHCKTLTLKKGKYICVEVTDYEKDILSIGRAFDQILSQPGLDAQGYCVEWYKGKDVTCMVRMEEK